MVKYIITICLILLTVVAQAESIHFRVISKIKQVGLENVGQKINGNGQIISVDGEYLTFSNYSKSFKISEQSYETIRLDNYYSFAYYDHKRKFYTTVLFDNNGSTVIIITDENGIGFLYYVEVI